MKNYPCKSLKKVAVKKASIFLNYCTRSVGYKCIQKKAWDGKKLSIRFLVRINFPRYAKISIANDWVLPMIGQQRYLPK
jgi:hypothetical protein